MTLYRRSPRPLVDTLEQMQGDLAPQTLLARVQQQWGEAVGEVIAAQARPVAERSGVLTVACEAAVWTHELDLMAPVILERLNGVLEGGGISRLRCVCTPAWGPDPGPRRR